MRVCSTSRPYFFAGLISTKCWLALLSLLVIALLSCGGIALPGASVAGGVAVECKETLKDALMSQKSGVGGGALLLLLLFYALIQRALQKALPWRRKKAALLTLLSAGSCAAPPGGALVPLFQSDPLLGAFSRGILHGRIYGCAPVSA